MKPEALIEDYWNNTYTTPIFELLCDKELGQGTMRIVYSLRHNPNFVVKVATSTRGTLANTQEYLTWKEFSFYYGNIDKNKYPFHPVFWLAPVHQISSDNRGLIQSRCEPIPQSIISDLVNGKIMVPSWFEDIKIENFGMLNGELVIVDYGYHRLLTSTQYKTGVRYKE